MRIPAATASQPSLKFPIFPAKPKAVKAALSQGAVRITANPHFISITVP
jgi:hypothetical protein